MIWARKQKIELQVEANSTLGHFQNINMFYNAKSTIKNANGAKK